MSMARLPCESDGDRTSCPACLQELPSSDILSLGCTHGFCRGCLQTFVEASAPLPQCPTGSCRAIVTEDVVEIVLGSAGVSAFRDALLERALQEMPGRVACPNPTCGAVVLCEGHERRRIACACGHPPFCSKCRQQYHYHSDCSAVQSLREQWTAWLNGGLEHYAGLEAGFERFVQERTAALEVASQRHQELADDELYKATHCRLCPHCYRPVERIDGCSSMRCGENYHGGAQQSGCGKNFSWTTAPPYRAVVEERNLPDVDIGGAMLRGAGCRHLFTRCALCENMIRGPRLRCIHCESFDICLDCLARSPHPQEHIFEVLYAPIDPPIEDMPRGTSVSVFGLEGAGAVLNGCDAQVWRYSFESGLYELKLKNGSRPVVLKEHVQPAVEDPAAAQTILELALSQQEMKQGFHFGLDVGCLARIVDGVLTPGDTFDPVARIQFYDPAQRQYGVALEEPLQWACHRCTLLNEPQARRCLACDANAPSALGAHRVAVEHVQPLVCNMEDVKKIAKIHWAEVERLRCRTTYPILESFDDFDATDDLLRGIYSYGYEKPSYMQQHAIVPILNGRDLIAQGRSCSGKTTAFLIGVLARIDYDIKACQGLVICPTRELTRQTEKQIFALGDYLNISCTAVFGTDREQIDRLRDGQHLVVGTPGRIYDIIRKRHLKLENLRTFILDDVDELLSRGFKDHIDDIFKCLPDQVQVCISCTTMSPDVLDLTQKRTQCAVRIEPEPPAPVLRMEGVQHFYIAIEKEEWKLDTICDLYETVNIRQAIIYCNTRRKVDFLVDQLRRRDFLVSMVHSELGKREKDFAMREFRSGVTHVLISTDSQSCGNAQQPLQPVPLVINYDLPLNMEQYLPRVGHMMVPRTRPGRTCAINFVTNQDVRTMKDIEKYYHIQIDDMPMDIDDILNVDSEASTADLERLQYVAADPRRV